MTERIRMRTVRVPDELWDAAMIACNRRNNRSVSAVIRASLEAYVRIPDDLWTAVMVTRERRSDPSLVVMIPGLLEAYVRNAGTVSPNGPRRPPPRRR